MTRQCPGLLPDVVVSTATQGQLRFCTVALNFSITVFKTPKLGQEAWAPQALVSSSVGGMANPPPPGLFGGPSWVLILRSDLLAQRVVGKCCGFA